MKIFILSMSICLVGYTQTKVFTRQPKCDIMDDGMTSTMSRNMISTTAPIPPVRCSWNSLWSSDVKTITPQMYGAKADGITDDSVAIQAAFDSGISDVYFSTGTYMVPATGYHDGHAGGVRPRSNTSIRFAPGAVLRVMPSSETDYNVLRLENASNVKISGGTIQGERHEHTGSAGEFGYCLGIWGGSDIWVENVALKGCWGDGIYIARSTTNSVPQRVTIQGVDSNDNRRQGMSIVAVEGLRVSNSRFRNTKGKAPQDGVDIEPGGNSLNVVRDVLFEDCTFSGNAGSGWQTSDNALPLGRVTDIQVIGSTASRNKLGIAVSGGLRVSIIGVTANQNDRWGFYVESAFKTRLIGNTAISNSQLRDASYANFHIAFSEATEVIGNYARKGDLTKKPRYGLRSVCSSQLELIGNDFRDSGTLQDVHITPTAATTKRIPNRASEGSDQ